MEKFVNDFTGEVLPFATPYSVKPDKGMENTMEDECVISDYVPISVMIKQFTRQDWQDLADKMDTKENELGDIDDDSLEDYFSEDELENQFIADEFLGSVAVGESSAPTKDNTTAQKLSVESKEDKGAPEVATANDEASDA